MFLHRTIPATYSENGSYCPSLEQEFFGASSNGEYSFDKWVKGELIQTEILDAMRTIGTQVGFMDLNTCKKHNPIMYYENDSETLGLCRDGARNLTSKNMVFITSSIIKDLGEHPEDKKPVRVMKGQYGPYIKYKSLNATILEEKDPPELTMEEALILIEKRKE